MQFSKLSSIFTPKYLHKLLNFEIISKFNLFRVNLKKNHVQIIYRKKNISVYKKVINRNFEKEKNTLKATESSAKSVVEPL